MTICILANKIGTPLSRAGRKARSSLLILFTALFLLIVKQLFYFIALVLSHDIADAVSRAAKARMV